MLLHFGLYTEKSKKKVIHGGSRSREGPYLNAAQVFPASTKQNLTEANHTGWVLEAYNGGNLILVRQLP